VAEKPKVQYRLELANSKKQTSIDQMISKLTGSITEVGNKVKLNLNELKNNMKSNKSNMICTDYKIYDVDCYDKNNINLDMQFISYSKNKFFKYLNQRHDENLSVGSKKILSKFEDEQRNINADDIVCAICNDGDYEDNDLIVFCSVIILFLFINRIAIFLYTNFAMVYWLFQRTTGSAMRARYLERKEPLS
jgi:hypothetical protein